MSPNLLQHVQQTIAKHDLLTPGEHVVVGVSGGPDSLALLHILRQLSERFDFHLHVAHLNHGARGKAADADAEFVRRTAEEWGLPVTVREVNVPALADRHQMAFEETARRVRYAFLADVAAEIDADAIAVGHNADDQAETVLMHFLRGAALGGLRGMLPSTPIREFRMLTPFLDRPLPDIPLIRPLLETPRDDIVRYCESHRLTPRFDRSNLDRTYFRNRLRHDLIPRLETYQPNIRERLCHTAAVIAAEYELLQEVRDETWREIVRGETEARVEFDLDAWRALPVALQRSTIRRAAYELRRSLRDVGFVHVENARQIALSGETGDEATLPMDLALTVRYETLRIADRGTAGPPPDEPLLWSEEPLEVQIPGSTPLPESEWRLSAQFHTAWDLSAIAQNPDPWTAYLDADKLRTPLRLRPRKDGDRFQPFGMEGHTVRMSAYMINEKIPEPWRDHVPLLTSAGEIAWVCGRRIAEPFAIDEETETVARLRFERE